MKKLIIIIFLINLFNCNSFAAQAKTHKKNQSDNQKIQELKKFLQDLICCNLVWNANKIAEEIEKIKKMFLSVVDKKNLAELILNNVAQCPKLIELAKWSIEKGANVNRSATMFTYLPPFESTPLSMAAHGISGELNSELIEILIKNGADVNYTLSACSPLNEAAYQSTIYEVKNRNWEKTLKLLLMNGAIIDEYFNHLMNKPENKEKKEIFEQIKSEIIERYRPLINKYNKLVNDELRKYLKHEDLVPTHMQEYDYLIPEYTNDQILENIVSIRQTLGEPKVPIEFLEKQPAAAAAIEPRSEGGAAAAPK